MKPKAMVLALVLMVGVMPIVVHADPWSAIDSGFAVTTNHHGEDIVPPPVPPLQAKVGLLLEYFADLDYVEVRLRDPDEDVVVTVIIDDTDPRWQDGTSPHGKPIKYAWTDDLVPAVWEIGHYSVKAYFVLIGEKDINTVEDLDAMRATTVMTVPEVPLGTLAVLLTMLASLGILARRKL